MKHIDYFSLYDSICATIRQRDGAMVWSEIIAEARKQFPLILFKARQVVSAGAHLRSEDAV